MSGLIRSETLVKTNVDANNNKFWKVEQFDNHTVQVINGRVGSAGQTQPLKSFASEDLASRFLDSKMRSKIRDGYKPFNGINTGSATKTSVSRMALEIAATKQIRTNDPDVVIDLIKRLVKANVHSILSSTDLKYDEQTGLFQTPLGVVTMDTIQQARSLLNTLADFVKVSDFSSAGVKAALADYLMLIPQKVGRKLIVEDVIPDEDAVVRQSGILDDLESSVSQALALKDKPQTNEAEIEVPAIFSCGISLVHDAKVLAEIERFYQATAKRQHASFGLRIKTVYQVCIDDMEKAYEGAGKSVGNVMRLWHGTRPGNILSILKSGLIIPPSSASHVCGRMFGNGLYFSDQSTKSLNYATGWWSGTKEKQCFMFLADVAMGKMHHPKRATSQLPMANSDSTFAKAGQSGVQNNEMIVYKTQQADLKYLVEFH